MANALTNLIEGATNVYRTKCFIVIQRIEILSSIQEKNVVLSHDTYIPRDQYMDTCYEEIFVDKIELDGARLPSTIYERKYL